MTDKAQRKAIQARPRTPLPFASPLSDAGQISPDPYVTPLLLLSLATLSPSSQDHIGGARADAKATAKAERKRRDEIALRRETNRQAALKVQTVRAARRSLRGAILGPSAGAYLSLLSSHRQW